MQAIGTQREGGGVDSDKLLVLMRDTIARLEMLRELKLQIKLLQQEIGNHKSCNQTA